MQKRLRKWAKFSCITGSSLHRAADRTSPNHKISTPEKQAFLSGGVTVQKLPDLSSSRGRLVIVRFGSLPDFRTRMALKKIGVSASDVTLLQIGRGQPGRFAALKSGGVQGLVVAPPMTRVAIEQGYYPFLDMIKEKIEYRFRHSCELDLFATEAAGNKKFYEGFVARIHYAKTHKEENMRITARYMKLDFNKDRAPLEET